jgi:uncharacterized membrane protein YoaT (DUF817 family)
MTGWSVVPLAKLGSWFLLLLVSYALVAIVNRPVPVDALALQGSDAQPVNA